MNESRPLLADKPLGATPLQVIHLLRAVRPELADETLAYAGRLDPMATGLLPILAGPLAAHPEQYRHFPKTYEATVALGLRSDSCDLLGIPERLAGADTGSERILAAVQTFVGRLVLPLPAFSSHRMNGKALFAWAREKGAWQVAVPLRAMAVNEITVTGMSAGTVGEIASRACERIALVSGDFRQDESIAAWRALEHSDDAVVQVQMRVHCGAGTYIRSIAHELGRRLGTGGILADLRRTSVGTWNIADPDVISLVWPRQESAI